MAALLTQTRQPSLMKMVAAGCAFTLCFHANEKWLREVGQVGSSGLRVMSSEGLGVQGKTGRSILQQVVHYQPIPTCARCGRHSGAKILKTCCVQILVQ